MIPGVTGGIVRRVLVTFCVLLVVCWPVEGKGRSDCIAPIQYYDDVVDRCSPCPALCRGAPEECRNSDRCTDYLVFNETFGYLFSELYGVNKASSALESQVTQIQSLVGKSHVLLVILLVFCVANFAILVLLIIVIALTGWKSCGACCFRLKETCCPDKTHRQTSDPLPLVPVQSRVSDEEARPLLEHPTTTAAVVHEHPSQPKRFERSRSQESATHTGKSRLASVSEEETKRSNETVEKSESSVAAAAQMGPKLDKPGSLEGRSKLDPPNTVKSESQQVQPAPPPSALPSSTHRDMGVNTKESEKQDHPDMRALAVNASVEGHLSHDSLLGTRPSAGQEHSSSRKFADEKEAVDTQSGSKTQSHASPHPSTVSSIPTTREATSAQPPKASGQGAPATPKPQAEVKPNVSNPSASKAEGEQKSDSDSKSQTSGATQQLEDGATALAQPPPQESVGSQLETGVFDSTLEIDTPGSGLVGQPQSDAEGTDEDDGGNDQPALVLLLPGGEKKPVRSGRITSETQRISEPIGRQTPTPQLGRYRDDPISTMPSDPGGGLKSLYSRSGVGLGMRPAPGRVGAAGDQRRRMPSIPTQMTDQLKSYLYVNLIAVDQDDVLRINVDPPKFTQACRELPRVIRQFWKVPKRFKIEAKDQE